MARIRQLRSLVESLHCLGSGCYEMDTSALPLRCSLEGATQNHSARNRGCSESCGRNLAGHILCDPSMNSKSWTASANLSEPV
ncbi:Uncharacterized protein HZ326_17163 [Fusarium oxysporum f. sp. albedinis]|nr:Uncharacterized protein HZ326_17163 [Fusarium oxysporum f. sp. albedinis]